MPTRGIAAICARCLAPLICFVVCLAAALLLAVADSGENTPPQKSSAKSSTQKKKLPKARQLDSGVTWQRDPATGELIAIAPAASGEASVSPSPVATIRVTSQIVPVTCSVFNSDGTAITGLKKSDFRIYEDGAEQNISYFAVATEPASVALIIDASPSVLRDSDEMKEAALALVEGLGPDDQVAVVDFSAHTYLQADFSSDREQIRRGVGRVDVRKLLGDKGGSNIYQAVYLTAAKVFLGGREGRKAAVLLTDGQDSGMGLTSDPASAAPRAGQASNRLTFEDLARTLAAEDIQVFIISTQNRPKLMTPDWLAAHRDLSLLLTDAAKSGVPVYTLYLAELVRRSGGQLYFLRDSPTLTDIFRRIAQRIGTEYTLGYYPVANAASHAGWRRLRVEVAGHSGATIVHRAAYYAATVP